MTFRILLVAVALNGILFGWPQVSKDHQPSTSTAAEARGKTNRVVPPTHVIIDQPYPIVTSKPETSEGQPQPKEKSSRWFVDIFTKPEWVIVDVTAVYAIIAGWTLIAIRRQANLMKQQVDDAKASSGQAAETASGTLKAIEDQAKLMALQTVVMQGHSKAADDSAIAAKESAESARRSVELAATQLEMAERPWLSVKVFAKGDITYDQLGINIPVEIEINNIGKTPANRIDMEAIMYCLGGDRDARTIRDQLIHNMRHGTMNIMSRTIFPGEFDDIPTPLLAHDHTRRFETMREIAGSPADVICAVAIVCVTYRPTFETELPYFTGVIYDIGRDEGARKLNVLKPGETVSSGNWYVTRQSNRGTVAG